jgi:hypothetical protein
MMQRGSPICLFSLESMLTMHGNGTHGYTVLA